MKTSRKQTQAGQQPPQKAAFSKVSWHKRGYAPAKVDELLARAKRAYVTSRADDELAAATGQVTGGNGGDTTGYGQAGADFDTSALSRASFKLVHGGYAPAAVDSALDRLKAAFVKRRRAAVVAQRGEQAWLDMVSEQVLTLYPRLQRPARERFADATGRGYEKDSVDGFLDLVSDYLAGKAKLTAHQVVSTTFPAAKREEAYQEAVVDAYLERLIDVLLAVE